MNVGLYCPSLFIGKGGAERFCAELANWLTGNGHNCHILSDDARTIPVYTINRKVHLNFLPREIEAASKYVATLGLDVLCSVTYDARAKFPVRIAHKLGLPVVITEQSHPDHMDNDTWNREERLAINSAADIIHVLSQNYKNLLPDFLKRRARVISNPTSIAHPLTPFSDRDKIILCVGALRERTKHQSILVSAFTKIAEKYPDWKLIFLGDGALREYLSMQAQKAGLMERILFPGVVEEPGNIYASASIFCLPSRTEGIPLVILEAQSYGLPCIGFADCSGVNELVENGANGILVEERTPQALAAALEQLMDSPPMREKMGRQARADSLAHEPAKIFGQWEELLAEAASCKGNTRLRLPTETEEEAALRNLRHILASAPATQARVQYTHAIAQMVRTFLR